MREALRTTQNILNSIDRKENIFFNVAKYENELQLVKSRKRYTLNSTGNREAIGHDYFLTTKGKAMQNQLNNGFEKFLKMVS